MPPPVRVFIVEDHRILAEGLVMVLGQSPDIEVVGYALDIAEALRLLPDAQPNVLLLDYYLPDGTAAEAGPRFRALVPDAAIVILTAETDDAAMLAAVEIGATGYLYKTQAAAKVVDAVRRAAVGEMLIPPATLLRLIQFRRAQDRSAPLEFNPQLTAREHEVLQLMAQGLDNYEIASSLVIGYTTVRSHVQRLLAKLETHSKLEAVARASELGLLER